MISSCSAQHLLHKKTRLLSPLQRAPGKSRFLIGGDDGDGGIRTKRSMLQILKNEEVQAASSSV